MALRPISGAARCQAINLNKPFLYNVASNEIWGKLNSPRFIPLKTTLKSCKMFLCVAIKAISMQSAYFPLFWGNWLFCLLCEKIRQFSLVSELRLWAKSPLICVCKIPPFYVKFHWFLDWDYGQNHHLFVSVKYHHFMWNLHWFYFNFACGKVPVLWVFTDFYLYQNVPECALLVNM